MCTHVCVLHSAGCVRVLHSNVDVHARTPHFTRHADYSLSSRRFLASSMLAAAAADVAALRAAIMEALGRDP